MVIKAGNPFGVYLRDRLLEMDMSMRKLANRCGYDPATISRLVNGKQEPRPDHLVRIAHVLQVPVIQLWQAAGFIGRDNIPEDPLLKASPHPSREIPKNVARGNETDLGVYSLQSLESLHITRILAELEKYRLYAQTDEGHRLILEEFDKKMNQVKGIGPFIDKLHNMYGLYRDDRTEPEQRHIIGSVLLYFILPTDIIPDYLFPTGYLDDAMAIDIVWGQLQSPPKPGEE
ncbi:MAG: helix-turn-helix domain-containing protein [Peptococcaceae bacterium]|nr:helix-turn-helix domain-containing protein [Peptococcaceae bacterium]